MFSNMHALLAMATPPGQAGGSGSMVSTLIMFGGIILIMYFLMIRPQQKRQKEHKNMLSSLKKGDKVVTSSGIHGTITDSDDTTFEIQVSDSSKIRFDKAAITIKK